MAASASLGTPPEQSEQPLAGYVRNGSGNGLVIDPTILSDWNEYSVRREFRGASYDITVENPGGESGVAELVDDESVDGITVPDFGDGETHDVRVVLG